jgi:hypothetical protein
MEVRSRSGTSAGASRIVSERGSTRKRPPRMVRVLQVLQACQCSLQLNGGLVKSTRARFMRL